VYRTLGAGIRALIVAIIIILPSALVSAGASQAQTLTFTFALVASAVVFVEYLVEAPAVLEFRFASPYNRLRILLMACLAIILSQGLANNVLNPGSGVISVVGAIAERVMINWPSPATVLVNSFAVTTVDLNALLMRVASVGFVLAFLFTLIFGAYLWLGTWPLSNRGFNLWPNMPSFSARAGQKASTKILQVAILSLVLAVTLPYIIPYVVSYGRTSLGINYDDSYLILYWVLLLWSVLPAMALFRAISLMKLAFLAENIRKF
jgi:hypothetical protein